MGSRFSQIDTYEGIERVVTFMSAYTWLLTRLLGNLIIFQP